MTSITYGMPALSITISMRAQSAIFKASHAARASRVAASAFGSKRSTRIASRIPVAFALASSMASAPGSTISRGAAIRPGPLPSTPTVNSRYRHHSSTSKPGCAMTGLSDSSLSQRTTPALSAPTTGLTTTGRPRFSTMFLAETPGPLTIQAGVDSPREEITRFMNSLSWARTHEDPPPTIAIPLAASGSTKGSEKLIRLLLGKTIVRSVPGCHSGKSAGDSMI